ncbi:MAG: GDP-mannose dehydrogenase [Nitrosopumilaceae archaeon]
MSKKDIVIGLGEIGKPIMELISKAVPIVGYDINQKLMDKNKFYKYEKVKTSFLHICIPFTKNFIFNVISFTKKFQPEGIVIHSTISPYTTSKIQSLLPIPVIYSATRGVHKRMHRDLRRYKKFYAIEPNAPRARWASSSYSRLMKKCGLKTKKMSNPLTLELAKIVTDTSYYGWLINYAQLSNMITIKHKINYDEMWSFADEIHKFLGNRPKMFPDFIGGHCVIPNLDLISDKTLNLIREINSDYAKILKKRHSWSKHN